LFHVHEIQLNLYQRMIRRKLVEELRFVTGGSNFLMQKNEYANVYESFVVIKKKKILCEIKG